MGEEFSDATKTRVAQIGLAAIKNAVLINSGACIAIFTLLGHVATSQTNKLPVAGFRFPLIFFAAGVLSAAVGSGAAWFAEGFSEMDRQKPSQFWSWITVSLVALSFVLFAAGLCATYSAISSVHG